MSNLPMNTRYETQAPPRTSERNRILCMKLQKLEASSAKLSWSAIGESFLKFSPRVQLRVEPSSVTAQTGAEGTSAWIFLDIASTSHLFATNQMSEHSLQTPAAPGATHSSENNGEAEVLHQCVSLARDLSLGVQYSAVADTPAGAQAFATSYPHQASTCCDLQHCRGRCDRQVICAPGEERERLKDLSLPLLLQLEGLKAWDKTSTVESVVTFFLMLGFKKIGEVSRFPFASFQERWGEVGALLWRRIHGEDVQTISPLLPNEPLEDYAHLDFPVSLVSILIHRVEKSFDFLFARLAGRRLFARKLVVILHCEYSQTQHRLEIEPNTPCRDRELFTTLLENKLSDLDLENPIRDFEVKIDACPEKSRQLDFFEPRTTDRDKLQTLFSLLAQSALKPGLYEIEPAVMPEQTWQLRADHSEEAKATEPPRALQLAWEMLTRSETEPESRTEPFARVSEENESYMQPLMAHEKAISPAPVYGENVMMAPRPTRLLVRPRPLALDEMQDLKFLSHHPVERLENGWWKEANARAGPSSRDYFFAVSPEGQCLWIYRDIQSGEHFLHGYFD